MPILPIGKRQAAIQIDHSVELGCQFCAKPSEQLVVPRPIAVDTDL